VTAETGETRTAAQWVGAGGRARMLRNLVARVIRTEGTTV
jgi:hypothetical protein